ncbi:MAG UNVERIFIED_CONTAM: AAA family ATPase, partial [Klebsiella aerogenes]
MTITKLTRNDLAPDTESYQALFTQVNLAETEASLAGDLQPRLFYALEQLLITPAISSFMLVKAPEEPEYLHWVAEAARSLQQPTTALFGVRYQVNGGNVTMSPAQSAEDNFASSGPVESADWIEAEQLFGCVRQFNGEISLQPGLVHRANGGVLLLSLRALLAQPLLWMRLKNMVTRQRFDWLSIDESRPLPVSIPSMPLNLRIILIGERDALADFQEMEPELASQAIYSEYEDNLQIADADTLKLWCQWVWQHARQLSLPGPAADAWPLLIEEGVRDTGDQETLPLSPLWIGRQLREAAAFCEGEWISGAEMQTMLERREWREGYLAERMRDEILLDQIMIDTEGECIGQINALSVIEFPGHPRAFGEPSRISCVVHIGDGEFIDVERKAELGGNIHAKGMMIMQAFIMSELELEQQLPFSASLTFEQSYSEVDGDSASMAELW